MKIMKVWITKYALTNGVIEEREAELCLHSDPKGRMIRVIGELFLTTYHKPHWHETKEEAIAKVEDMRKKKIASLKKAISKLEELRIDFVTKG